MSSSSSTVSSQRHSTQRRNGVHAIYNPGSHAGVIDETAPYSIAPFRDTAGDLGVSVTAAKSPFERCRAYRLGDASPGSFRATTVLGGCVAFSETNFPRQGTSHIRTRQVTRSYSHEDEQIAWVSFENARSAIGSGQDSLYLVRKSTRF